MLNESSIRLIWICAIGFLICFKPSEPFLTPFLLETKQLSEYSVYSLIYPIWTYSYFGFILPIAFIAENLTSYKYLVLSGLVAREVTRLLLLFANGVTAMQAMQVFFGYASASEFLLFSFIFSITPIEYSGVALGLFRGCMLLGHVGSGFLGQALVDGADLSLKTLFIISFATVTVGLLLFLLFLPKGEAQKNVGIPILQWPSELYSLFKNPWVVLWSTWFWIGNAALDLILNYQTGLFHSLSPDKDFDGYVVPGGRMAAALCAVLGGWLAQRISFQRSLIPMFVSAIACGALALGLAYASNLNSSFAYSILYYGITEGGIIMATTMLARQLEKHHYALLFGWNTFISVGIQTAVQAIIDHTTDHEIKHSMVIFGILSASLVGLLILETLGYAFTGKLRQQKAHQGRETEPLLPFVS